MKTIEQLYLPILTSIGLTASDDHYLFSDKEMKKPWTISGMPVLLPTRENTRQMVDNGIYFHPLSEDFFIGGQSNVIKRLKRTISATLERRLFSLALELSTIACNIKQHEKLSPKQQGLLTGLKSINANHQKAFSRWLRALQPNPNGGVLMALFLKENAFVEGHKYKRGAQITFEQIESLVKLAQDRQALDKFSKAETETIAGVLSYIIQPWTEEFKQEFGSDSSVAPYFASLLEAYDAVMTRLNYLHALFYELTSPTYRLDYPNPKEMASTEWLPTNEWAKVYREIPPLPHNRGAEDRENSTDDRPAAVGDLDRDTIKAAPVVNKPQPSAAPAQRPQQPRQPVQVEPAPKAGPLTDNKGGVKIVEFNQLPGSQIPQYDQWGNPIPINNSTFYPQPVPVQQFQQQPAFVQQQQTFVAPVQQQQRFIDSYGRLCDANGNVLAVPAGAVPTMVPPQQFQNQNPFAAGPFAPAAPSTFGAPNQFGAFNGGLNTGFNLV